MKKQITCPKGHVSEVSIKRWRGNGVISFCLDGDETWYYIVDPESYAYTRGGCCYRAANDAARTYETLQRGLDFWSSQDHFSSEALPEIEGYIPDEYALPGQPWYSCEGNQIMNWSR